MAIFGRAGSPALRRSTVDDLLMLDGVGTYFIGGSIASGFYKDF
tara:strand:- start:4 stop:135 length:132 start_codon:yes stop_codon:yes gene_type:complete